MGFRVYRFYRKIDMDNQIVLQVIDDTSVS